MVRDIAAIAPCGLFVFVIPATATAQEVDAEGAQGDEGGERQLRVTSTPARTTANLDGGASTETPFDETISRGELGPNELRDTKEHLKGRILLGLETASARMMRVARNEIYFGRQVSEREAVRLVDKVTRDDVVEMAYRLLDPENLTIVSLGPSTASLKSLIV